MAPTSRRPASERVLLAVAVAFGVLLYLLVLVAMAFAMRDLLLGPEPPVVTPPEVVPVDDPDGKGSPAVELPGAQWADLLVADELLVVPNGDWVFGLRRDDLTQQWATPCRGASWIEPTPSDLGGRALLSCRSATLIDLDTGQVRWQNPAITASSLFRAGPGAIVMSHSNGIDVFDPDTGRPSWQRQLGHNQGVHPVAVDTDTVYVSENFGLVAYDARTGDPQWRVEVPTASIAHADGNLYIRTDNHYVVALEASDGTQRWRSRRDTSGLSWAAVVAVSDDAVVLASSNISRTVAYDRSTGEVLWSHEALETPVIAGRSHLAIRAGQGRRVIADRTGATVADLDTSALALSGDVPEMMYHVSTHSTRAVLVAEPIPT